MKYYIAYPILYDCNLRCSYCFHHERFITNYTHKPQFKIKDYILFRDTHLMKDAEDIIVHFHGGEPFIDTNINIICSFMKQAKVERIDMLTNGIQKFSNYIKVIKYKNRIDRIGFTYHRRMIDNIRYLKEIFEENVIKMHELGIPVYVKELLFTDLREEIKASKRYWESKGIKFLIQDFKGDDRGKDFSEHTQYNPLDILLIDPEYRHTGEYCSCRKGYRNVLIGGHSNSGDIIACFEDMKIVGNIQRNEYNPNYKIFIDRVECRIDVQGVPPVYKGTWDRGLYKSKQCGKD